MEIAEGVYGFALDAYFIMQVRSRADTRKPHRSDGLPRFDFIPGSDRGGFQMAIGGRKAVAVVDTNHESIVPLPSDVTDRTIRRG